MTTKGIPSRSSTARAGKLPSQGTAITPAGRHAVNASICRISSSGSPPLVATRRRRPLSRASRSSLSTNSAKNGLPSSGTMAPTTVRWELRSAEAATSRR